MKEKEIVVGLDIGTTKVVVIVGYKDDNGKIHVLGYGHTESVGVLRGSVINVDKTAESIRAAVEEAELRAQVDIHEVYVGIAGQHIKSRQQSGGMVRQNQEEEISREEVVQLIESMKRCQVDPGENIIHVIPQEFIVDGVHGISEDDVVGMSGANLEANFHIITAHFAAMRNIQRSVEKAGLEIGGFVLEPLVSAEAVLDQNDKEAGVVLVDIGGGTTDVAIFNDSVLCHTAVIPLAGNIITKDIKEGCGILPKQAEALKIKFGSALPSENSDEKIVSIPGLRGRSPKEISLKSLANFIGARMDEVLQNVAFEISNSGCNSNFIGGIVLTGGGSKLKHVVQLADYVTGIESRIGYPNEHLTEDSPKELNDPIFSTGIGLVIYGIRCEEEKTERKMAVEELKRVDFNNVLTEEPIETDSEEKDKKKDKKKKWGGLWSSGSALDNLVKFFDDDSVK
ncbi:MAG: cell division protein FtsA [Bacteroidales bacterium]